MLKKQFVISVLVLSILTVINFEKAESAEEKVFIKAEIEKIAELATLLIKKPVCFQISKKLIVL